MGKNECRESRPVPFSPSGIVWEMAAEGELRSWDVGEKLDKQGRLLPSPKKRTPFQQQLPPGSLAKAPTAAARLPLAPVGGNELGVGERVLATEVRALEVRAERLEGRVHVQQRLIEGLCKLVADTGRGR